MKSGSRRKEEMRLDETPIPRSMWDTSCCLTPIPTATWRDTRWKYGGRMVRSGRSMHCHCWWMLVLGRLRYENGVLVVVLGVQIMVNGKQCGGRHGWYWKGAAVKRRQCFEKFHSVGRMDWLIHCHCWWSRWALLWSWCVDDVVAGWITNGKIGCGSGMMLEANGIHALSICGLLELTPCRSSTDESSTEAGRSFYEFFWSVRSSVF